MELTDTHCHIHEAHPEGEFSSETRARYEKAGSPSPEAMIANAHDAAVTRLICVGTTLEDSQLAISFAGAHSKVWASIGIHPHEATRYIADRSLLDTFATLAAEKPVVAVGECGLDYYYNHAQPDEQQQLLHAQLQLAKQHDLPVIFHVRDAFADFWPIFEQYPGLRGVIHSFSSTAEDLKQILEHGLYVGVNGIATFMKDPKQLDAIRAVPLDKLLLETDAPFLTPTPYRGTMCEPKHIRVTAEFLAQLRDESLEEIARASTNNAVELFKLD